LARVRSVLRRAGRVSEPISAEAPKGNVRTFHDWTLDLDARALTDPRGHSVTLTSGEYRLLEAFVTHANRVLTRDQLLDLVCDNDAPAFDRSIDVRIGRVRKKLCDDPKDPRLIKTVRNGGYIFVGKVAARA